MLYLFWCYKRSGGTIANKFMASCKNTFVISEVGFYGSGWGARGIDTPRTIADQMNSFYQIEIKRGGFFYELRQVIELAKSHNKRLILRDWNVHYYEKIFFNAPFQINYYLNYLEKLGFNKFALVRNKSELWETLRFPNHAKFCIPYTRYLEDLHNHKFYSLSFEYELSHSFEGIREYFDRDTIKFEPTEDFYKYENVLGDTQILGTRNLNSSGLRVRRKKRKSIRKSILKLTSLQHRNNCFNANH